MALTQRRKGTNHKTGDKEVDIGSIVCEKGVVVENCLPGEPLE
jgi:hypothetical protein